MTDQNQADEGIEQFEESRAGDIIDSKFKLVEILGKGKASTVYLAEHLYLDKQVAVKLFNVKYLHGDKSIARTQKEARTCANLLHPNIVVVSDFGLTEEGAPYIVQEYVAGSDLKTMVETSGPLEEQRVVEIATQLADAIANLHNNGIIHRDIKSANVVVSRTSGGLELVKLIDLGIARLSNPGGAMQALTQSGEFFGSPYYMSPEQCRGHKVDTRADIYSFGCVLYEILTGMPPFRGDTMMKTMEMQISQPPEPVNKRSSQSKIDPRLEKVVMKCLSKDPKERYSSMKELCVALAALKPKDKTPLLRGGVVIAVLAALSLAIIFAVRESQDSKTAALPDQAPVIKKLQAREKAFHDILMASGRSGLLRRVGFYERSTESFEKVLEQARRQKVSDDQLLDVAEQYMFTLFATNKMDRINTVYNQISSTLDAYIERLENEKRKTDTGSLPALCYWSAVAALEKKAYFLAEERLDKGLKLAARNAESRILVPYYNTYKAKILARTNRTQEGLELATASRQALEQELGDNDFLVIRTMISESSRLKEAGQYEKALKVLDDAISRARHNTNIKLSRDVLQQREELVKLTKENK